MYGGFLEYGLAVGVVAGPGFRPGIYGGAFCCMGPVSRAANLDRAGAKAIICLTLITKHIQLFIRYERYERYERLNHGSNRR